MAHQFPKDIIKKIIIKFYKKNHIENKLKIMIGCINYIFDKKKNSTLDSRPLKYPQSVETPISKHVKANTFKALLATAGAFFSQVQTNLLDATSLFP